MDHSDNIQVIRCENNRDMVLIQMDRMSFLNFMGGYGASHTASRLGVIRRWRNYESIRESDFEVGISVYSKLKESAVTIATEVNNELASKRRGED